MSSQERLPESAEIDAEARIEQFGAFLCELREFSMSLTEAVDRARGGRPSSNAEAISLIMLRLDGPMRPRTLAAAAGLTTGGMTNLLDRLQAACLVRRSGPIDGDRRGVSIELTADGAALIDRTGEAARQALSRARPMIERWRDRFLRLGLEVGTFHLAAGRLSSLEQIRTLAAIGNEMRTAFAGVFGPDDPHPVTTFHVLWIASRDGGTRPSHITRAEQLSSAGTSAVLERLEGSGLVERARGADGDGRSVTVTVTDHGRRTLRAAIAAAAPAVEHAAHTLFPV